jgi:hypothetical protein
VAVCAVAVPTNPAEMHKAATPAIADVMKRFILLFLPIPLMLFIVE